MFYPLRLQKSEGNRRIETELLHDPFTAPEPFADNDPARHVEEDVDYYWEEDFDFDVGVGD